MQKENAISQSLPCFKLIEIMSLRQQQEDGFYYDSNGMLAAFDTDLTQKVNSVVVRKDILDTFLSKTGMKLVWLVDAEKEIHAGDYSITKWSDWEAVFIYEGDGIAGEIHRLQEKTNRNEETNAKSQSIMIFKLRWEKNAWQRTINRMERILA